MQGYAADHQDIALLKLRNFVLRRNISDEEITSENALNIVGDIVEAIEPFVKIPPSTMQTSLAHFIADSPSRSHI
jgi:hypothetical protein